MSLRLHVLAGGRLRSQAVALFDTGCHPDVATDPFKRWGGLAKAFRRWQARGAQVVFGHDARQWATLRKGLDAYE
jgi:hypothetical protein